MRARRYDLAVVDVVMPGRDGLWLATEMQRDYPDTAVIISTGYTGAEILACAPTLEPIAPIVLASHEWFDGSGDPRQLAGVAIPLASRIIGVIDAYDTTTEAGRNQGRVDREAAVSELLRGGGTRFDPETLAAFLAVLGKH